MAGPDTATRKKLASKGKAMPDGGTLTLRTDRIRIGAPMAERFVGEEVAPGVREVFLHKREVSLSAYKWAWLTDLIFQPGASIALDVVPNDTICLMVEGLLRVKLDEQEFIVTKNEHPLWASPKGAMERRSNTGADVAVGSRAVSSLVRSVVVVMPFLSWGG